MKARAVIIYQSQSMFSSGYFTGVSSGARSGLSETTFGRPVSLDATTAFNLTHNGAGVLPKQAGYLGGAMLGSHKALDLVSLFSAEVFVHWATQTM